MFSSTAASVPAPTATAAAVAEKPLNETDYYFNSYSHYGIHMEMLKDQSRTGSYRDAILKNAYLFKDKVVLDVGCGTGILSMFAAKAGARRVVGIDCSSIAVQAREIAKQNGFENVITILQGKVEELELPADCQKVDIIISEWMGYFLLYESMLQTVLFARDKWGTKDVKLFPNQANMYLCGICDPQYKLDRFDCWENVHGFDFSYFKRLSYIEPLVDDVDKAQVVTNIAPLFSFDINTVKEEELVFESTMQLKATRKETVHALSTHFDTPFSAGHEVVVLDTSPFAPLGPTHWHQTVLYLFNPISMEKGEVLHVHLKSSPNKDNPRDLDIQIQIDFDGAKQVSHYTQDFRLR